MISLTTVGSGIIGVGIILLLFIISESQDCTFSWEHVNLICETGNVSEKALFVIVGIFFLVLGYILYQQGRLHE